MRILFLTKTTELGAASRFRVYQFLPYLSSAGIEYKVVPATTCEQYVRFVRNPSPIGKMVWFATSMFNRFIAIPQTRRFDCVFVQKETLPFFFPAAELLLRHFAKRIVFDFDDAIFHYRHQPSPFMRQIMDRHSVQRILRYVDRVIVSNEYLATYARRFNADVRVIPTSIEMSHFLKPSQTSSVERNRICIGWIGSRATVGYLDLLDEVFARLAQQFDFELKIIGGGEVSFESVRVKCQDWRLESEVNDIRSFDIGVMPLRNDLWTRGKAGLKLLQYLAAGIPAVASRVGVNCEIVSDGKNGFLAGDSDEWVEKLGRLLRDAKLRQELGSEGQKTVIERYSVEGNFPKWLKAITEW